MADDADRGFRSRSADRIGPLLVGDKPMPHSPQAERAVLSCMLQDPINVMDLVFSRLTSDEAMYVPAHRYLLKHLREMRRNVIPGQIDMITILDYLQDKGALEQVGGEEAVHELFNVVPTTANAPNYVSMVLDEHLVRSMIRSCTDIVGRCYESEDDVLTLIDGIEHEIMDISQMRTSTQTRGMKELLPEAYNQLDAMHRKDPSMMGLDTGFFRLNELITGLKPGELFVLAARPSIGKTTLAVNIARNIAGNGKAVGMFSLEMGAPQVVVRIICSEARINLRDIRDGKLDNTKWQSDLLPACDRLKGMPLFIDDTPQISSLELRQKARRMYREHDICFIVIDYLQLMRPVGGNKQSNREQEVARMSSDLKALARELNVTVMVLAQLNRAAEQGGRPKLSNLRESGAIEQDADVVGLLHRERETESKEVMEAVRKGEPILCELIIAKNRNGATGIVPLDFFPQFTRFDSRSMVDDSDIPSFE